MNDRLVDKTIFKKKSLKKSKGKRNPRHEFTMDRHYAAEAPSAPTK